MAMAELHGTGAAAAGLEAADTESALLPTAPDSAPTSAGHPWLRRVAMAMGWAAVSLGTAAAAGGLWRWRQAAQLTRIAGGGDGLSTKYGEDWYGEHSLYCWTFMMPTGYEPQVMALQQSRGWGLFSKDCSKRTVFASTTGNIFGIWTEGLGDNPTYMCDMGTGTFACNGIIFKKAWKRIISDVDYRVESEGHTGRCLGNVRFGVRDNPKFGITAKWTDWQHAEGHVDCKAETFGGVDPAPDVQKECWCHGPRFFPFDWVVKVDCDAVWFPGLLKSALGGVGDRQWIYLTNNNGKFGDWPTVLGPIEVFSRNAIWHLKVHGAVCLENNDNNGEDGMISDCMQSKLKLQSRYVDNLLSENYNVGTCTGGYICYHAFKNVPSMEACYNHAMR